jgi:hypothetical protein
MDGNFKGYSYTSSSDRIKDILNQPAGTFQEVDGLPDRDRLTFTNGFYGMCSAVFIDIRDSSGLTDKHKRPTLAKIYRAFISEMVAVLNSDAYVREVNIVGDCDWAVYKTTQPNHIDDVFRVAFQANTPQTSQPPLCEEGNRPAQDRHRDRLRTRSHDQSRVQW